MYSSRHCWKSQVMPTINICIPANKHDFKKTNKDRIWSNKNLDFQENWARSEGSHLLRFEHAGHGIETAQDWLSRGARGPRRRQQSVSVIFGYPTMDGVDKGKSWENPSYKWMIWGYPYFGKPPVTSCAKMSRSGQRELPCKCHSCAKSDKGPGGPATLRSERILVNHWIPFTLIVSTLEETLVLV